MAESVYILVRLRHDFSIKEPNEEQTSQCFSHDIPKVRGLRSSVGKAQDNYKNNIEASTTSYLILKVNENFIFLSLVSPIWF